MKIINLKIDVLKPYDKNPRKNKEAVKYVAESIKEFEFKQPIVIDKNNVIVCGHTRLLAAKQLGLKEVPCILADDLTKEQINAYRLVDNKTNEFAEWDNELLKETSQEYKDLKTAVMESRAYFDNTHDNMKSVWEFGRTKGTERELCGGHATPKPIALCSRAIKSSSREGEIVLDVFGGSGSTLIACEQLNRKCYMMELDEHYCDIIINRWESFTRKKAELIE